MPKGIVFIGNDNVPYGFISNAQVYGTAQVPAPGLFAATGLKPVANLPSKADGVLIPHRLQDLLQAGELKTISVALDDGAGKRTNRRLFINAAAVGTFRNLSGDGGLIGLTIDGKKVVSATLPRKASNTLA